MTREQEFDHAARKADAARQDFMASWQNARWRLAPAQLKAEAQEKVADALQQGRTKMRQSVRSHPLIVGGTLLGLVGWLFRKPIAALSGRLYVKARDAITEEEQ